MLGFPDKKIVDELREQYPVGTRIALINMNDPDSKLVPGDRGSVIHIDAIGTVHVRWDSGSGLRLAYGEDSFRKLTEQELAAEKMSEQGYEDEDEPEI